MRGLYFTCLGHQVLVVILYPALENDRNRDNQSHNIHHVRSLLRKIQRHIISVVYLQNARKRNFGICDCYVLTGVGRSYRRIFVVKIGITGPTQRYGISIDTHRVPTEWIPSQIISAGIAVLIESIRIAARVPRSRWVSPAASNRISVCWISIHRISIRI